MKKTIFAMLVLLLAVSVGCSGGGNQNQGGTGTTGSAGGAQSADQGAMAQGGQAGAQMSDDARQFVREAAMAGRMEVELGNLAQKQAQNAQVKEFAARMVRDHSQANEQLMSVVTQAGGTMEAPEPDAAHKDMMDKMQASKGRDFDRMYMQHMVEDHQKDVQKYEQASNNLKEEPIKNFAAQTLPVLREHLQLAQQTAQKVGAKTAAGGSGSTQ